MEFWKLDTVLWFSFVLFNAQIVDSFIAVFFGEYRV